jgi:hypothetical protein
LSTRSSTTIIPLPNPEPTPAPNDSEWQAAAAAVKEHLTDWQRPLADARKNGLEPQDVLNLIAVWQSEQAHFQSPLGALHYALRKAEPRHAESGWVGLLPLSEEALRLRRRAEREAQQRRCVADRPAQGDASPDARLRQLEFAFDGRLKGQTVGEVIQRYAVPDAIAARLASYRDHRWSSSLRIGSTLKLALLEHLAGSGVMN